MGTIPKLHEYLLGLDFASAKSSKDYIGTKNVNPAMFLEDNVPIWSRMSTLAEISAALSVWKERVCVSDFPARFSPPFWLAHAALQTVYKVLTSYLLSYFCEEVIEEVNEMLFELWVRLISAGPGSSHLEMMDIILKNQHCPLWKYMESLSGDNLQLLLSTLKCDFVYQEDVSSDHYATLMETHIDKIFKLILRPEQSQEAQRGFLDLHLHYLRRMNHVPPHIGPRLSHLCFLICQKYHLENPYIGLDDWVLMRHHLKLIKDVVTDWTFTVASEAQYRAPITLEKIFQAAIIDKMLELMFKDFMALLLAMCCHSNSRRCKRLFLAYNTALFQQIDVPGMEVEPDWLFDQCITTLSEVARTNGIETHIEQTIITAEQECLLNMSPRACCSMRDKWHTLLENYVVSGRHLLVQEAAHLLMNDTLKDTVFNWKVSGERLQDHWSSGCTTLQENLPQARLLVDIISDLPKSFLQDDQESTVLNTVETYQTFLRTVISQLSTADLIPKVQDNLHKCVIKCLGKDPGCKAGLATLCLQEQVINLQDMNFLLEMLFCVDKLLKEEDCLTVNEKLSFTVESLLIGCLNTFREKGYISVDYNSLMISVCLTCISGDQYIQTDTTGPPYDIYYVLYNSVVLQFIRLHQTHNTLRLVTSLIPQVIQLIHEGIQQGTSIDRCVNFLHWLGTSCPELILGHMSEVIELFLDWECYSEIYPLLSALYPSDPLTLVEKVPVMFDKLTTAAQTDRQTLITVLHLVAQNHAEVFSSDHISQLVRMYQYETPTSQQLILQIIHRVAVLYPTVVFGFYPHFSDDTKFPITSLRDRAHILTALAENSEDLSKKTTDYLMTHLGSKDSAISLVAMEVLEPLLRQSPASLMKHKQKLRTIGKTSSSSRVKEICKDLVPESQVKVSKVLQKDYKDNKPPAKGPESQQSSFSKKTIKQNKPSKPVRSQKTVTDKQAAFETIPEPGLSGKKMTDNTDAKSPKNMDNAEIIEVTDNKTVAIAQDPEESLKNGEMVLQTKYMYIASEMVPARPGDEVTQTTYSELGDKETSKYGGGHTVSGMAEMRGEILEPFTERTEKVQQTREIVLKQHSAIESTNVGVDTLQADGVQSLNTEHAFQKIDAAGTPSKLVEQTETFLSQAFSDTLMPSPSIYLSFHPSSQSQASMVRRHLKMAGYECWVDTGQTGSGDGEMHAGIQEAKVVVCCLTKTYLTSSDCCKELSAAFTLSKPVIPLALEPLSVPSASLLKDHLAIRFYTKPAEVKVTMGFWVEHKFQELLMRLSYLRILPDESIVTKAYSNWWIPKCLPEDKGRGDTETETDVSVGGLPSVFISYNWGKQQLVKSLYHHLTNLGYSCWLGVYQMSGSESLYNKITQGLQGCRVMIACVTRKYTRADNCQQEIRLAYSLKRPIIPLVLEEVRWPLEGETGKLLMESECIKFENMNFYDTNFETLVGKLNLYVPNVREKQSGGHIKGKDKVTERDKNMPESKVVSSENRRNAQIRTSNSLSLITDKQTKHVSVRSLAEDKDQIKNSQKTMQKSSSMFEIDKSSNFMVTSDVSNTVSSKTDDDLIIKKSIPEGVTVDEMGYTVKSSRSKSCVIL